MAESSSSGVFARATESGNKRILSLDGGGIRGAISLAFLKRVESVLRLQHNNIELRLSDYFDLIIGTSTGAIIATGLALGMSVDEIAACYLKLGKRVFRKRPRRFLPWNWLRAPFDPKELEMQLKSIYGTATLGSSSIKTGLCIVTKRVDRESTWVHINHPKDRFFEEKQDLPLSQLVRASAAAPTYFDPELLIIDGGQKLGAFIDGGISMANNPALLGLMVATLQGFPYRWAKGADQLLTLSVGTGAWSNDVHVKAMDRQSHVAWAKRIPTLLMNDASLQNQLLVQLVSNCVNPTVINRQVGTAAGELGIALQTYIRYDVRLQKDAMLNLGLAYDDAQLEVLRDMSNPHNCETLLEIGNKAAFAQVNPKHFPSHFRRPIAQQE